MQVHAGMHIHTHSLMHTHVHTFAHTYTHFTTLDYSLTHSSHKQTAIYIKVQVIFYSRALIVQLARQSLTLFDRVQLLKFFELTLAIYKA